MPVFPGVILCAAATNVAQLARAHDTARQESEALDALYSAEFRANQYNDADPRKAIVEHYNRRMPEGLGLAPADADTDNGIHNHDYYYED